MTNFCVNIIPNRLVLRYRFVVPFLVALVVDACRTETLQTKENMDSKSFSAAIATFSAKFCNELEKDKSVVSSPLSAEFVLALLTLGSTDSVHSELLTALGFPDDDTIRSSFSFVSSKLKSIKGVTLSVANKIYIKDGGYELNPQLEEDAVKVFDAGFEKLDFNNSVAAAKNINEWVESKTNNRIKDLLSPDAFNDFTRLVLVNALYFKGTWKKQFLPQMTRPRAFHIAEGKTIEVPMMYIEDNYRYGESEELKAQLLQMDYVGGETSMIIVLPREVEGLEEVLQKLASGHDLLEDIRNMYNTKVNVHIPKFKIETQIDLMTVLPKLGIKEIFSQSNTGLSNILNTQEPLYVSTAVQKAFIEVNEEGAEAAAATGMVMMLRCALPPSPIFTADRSFLYLLMGADNVPAFIDFDVELCCARSPSPPVPQFHAKRPFFYLLMGANCVPAFIGMVIRLCRARQRSPPVPQFHAKRPFFYLLMGANHVPVFIGMGFRLMCARQRSPPVPQFYAKRSFFYMLMGANKLPAFVGTYRGIAD